MVHSRRPAPSSPWLTPGNHVSLPCAPPCDSHLLKVQAVVPGWSDSPLLPLTTHVLVPRGGPRAGSVTKTPSGHTALRPVLEAKKEKGVKTLVGAEGQGQDYGAAVTLWILGTWKAACWQHDQPSTGASEPSRGAEWGTHRHKVGASTSPE